MRETFKIVLPLASCVAALGQSGLFTIGGTFPVGADPGYHTPAPLLAIADFNRDGNLDIAHADESVGTVTLLLGDGKGNFTPAPASPIAVMGDVINAIATGDFNGDGNADLVVTGSSTATTEILLGDGRGGFTQGAGLPASSSVGGSILRVGDFNGDGKLDVLIEGVTELLVCLGDGMGGLGSPLEVSSAAPIFDAAVGDFNGDGILDLALLDIQPGNLEVYLGDGSGGFARLNFSYSLSVDVPQGAYPVDAAGDFDGNGIANIVTFGSQAAVGESAVLSWTGNLSSPDTAFTAVTSPISAGLTFVTVGDFDGDGKLDLAGVVNDGGLYTGGIMVALGDGTGNFAPATGSPFTVSGTPVALAVGDFNNDDKPDLAVDTGSNVVILLNTGSLGPQLQPQTIQFAPLTTVTYSAPPFTISATASSGLPVEFTETTPGVCEVVGDIVTILSAGTCSIQAVQPGNQQYSPAPAVTQSFTVQQATESITFNQIPNQTMGTPPVTPVASVSSGLPITYTAQPSSVCAVSGLTLAIVGAGTCSVTASQPGNVDYLAAAPVTETFTVTLAAQSITFPTLPTQQMVGGSFALNALATSFLAVTFVSNTPGVCTVSGTMVNLIALGTCSITASQSGNSTYAAAPSLTQTFAVISVSLQSQTITFGPLTGRTLGTGTFTVSATASSGLPVTFISATPAVCSLSGNTVTLVSSGYCTITASQGGNATYNAAPPASQSFQVSPAALTQQTITFAPIASVTLGTGTVTLSATASSGLPIMFTSLTQPVCTVSGTTVTLAAVGTCTIVAAQAGSSIYEQASATQSFSITGGKAGPTITTVENAASYAAGPVAPGSYVILFGSNLAAQVGDTSVAVSITDAGGSQISGGIIYTSAAQVNIFAPANLALGSGTVTLSNSSGISAPFTIMIGNISPGLFTVDAAGTMPAAQVVTTAADGSQIVQPVASCTASGCTLAPIVLIPGTPSYLILYGTGIRGAGNIAAVSVTIGGVPAAVEYAGPQGGYPGLDQVNALIPPSLAGQGQVSLLLSVFTTRANPVQLLFQ